jgi:hypothetical protein
MQGIPASLGQLLCPFGRLIQSRLAPLHSAHSEARAHCLRNMLRWLILKGHAQIAALSSSGLALPSIAPFRSDNPSIHFGHRKSTRCLLFLCSPLRPLAAFKAVLHKPTLIPVGMPSHGLSLSCASALSRSRRTPACGCSQLHSFRKASSHSVLRGETIIIVGGFWQIEINYLLHYFR